MSIKALFGIFLVFGFALMAQAASVIYPVDTKTYGDKIAVLGKKEKMIKLLGAENGAVERKIELSQEPNGMLIDGDTAYVVTGGPRGLVEIVDMKSGKVESTIPVGHTPMSPVKFGDTLYVANRFTGNVAQIDLKTKKVVKTIEAKREPTALALSSDGKTLWIANHLPAGPSDGEFTAADLSCYKDGKVTHYPLSNGSQGVRGMLMSPDGKYLAISHVLSRYQVPTTQLDRGWINTNAVTIIDVNKPDVPNSILLDDVDFGAANPWALTFTPDGSKLIVTHAGTQEISIIEFPALIERINKSAAENKNINRLSFLDGIRERVKLPLSGPRSVAVLGNNVYVGGYFSHNLAKVSLDQTHHIDAWNEGVDHEETIREKGERYFNDASLCFQSWQSCASCHPDSRVDALNWDLLNDGLGNPKNTRNMLISHKTPPVMTKGIRASAEIAVKAGFRHIQFVEPDEEHTSAVDAYLRDMPEVASPFLDTKELLEIDSDDPKCMQCHAPEIQRGLLSESAKRGKKLFKEQGCIECHKHPYFTTKEKIVTGTMKGLDEGDALVVPTLIEVWRTGPYMHDGRAATIEEVITKHNPGDKRGKTSNLSKQQLKDLVEYVKSL